MNVNPCSMCDGRGHVYCPEDQIDTDGIWSDEMQYFEKVCEDCQGSGLDYDCYEEEFEEMKKFKDHY